MWDGNEIIINLLFLLTYPVGTEYFCRSWNLIKNMEGGKIFCISFKLYLLRKLFVSDNIALEEKRRIAEEKRKKRANFLSNVGEFSETFSSDASKQTNQSEASSGGVQIPSSKYTSQVSKVKEQNDLEELKSLKSPVKSPNPKSQFMDESLSKSVANISISSSTISDSAGNDLGLAVPSRIGGMKATSKNDVHKASPNKVEIKSSFSPSSKTTGYESNDDDDDEEDYSSNLMSGSQKGQTQSKEDTSIESASESATWKAMQNDLTNKRKGTRFPLLFRI